MINNRVFTLQPTPATTFTQAVLWLGWYDPARPQDWATAAASFGEIAANNVAAKPAGQRGVLLRELLVKELYPEHGADPVAFFANGGASISRQVEYLRPFGQQLRQRGLALDAIYMENEGGFTHWRLSADVIRQIYLSATAKARMPPAVRALRGEYFNFGHPKYYIAAALFDAYAQNLWARTIKQTVVDSGIFKIPRTTGGPNVQPPTCLFWQTWPTFTVYDYNGWPQFPFSLDQKTSCPSCYLTPGQRHYRTHDARWNCLIDAVNMIRSCMRRPGAVVCPVISRPEWVSSWCFEHMIAHFARTGVNWTGGGCCYWYWKDEWRPGDSDLAAEQIFNRHDQAWAPIRNLPEIPLDVDSFTTNGFTSTYADFLANNP